MGKVLKQTSLTVKQVILTFIVTLVVGGGVTLLQSWYSLNQERAAAESRIQLLLTAASENAAASAFRLDSDLAEYVTTGLASASEIQRASILDESRTVLATRSDAIQEDAPDWLLEFAYPDLMDIEVPLFGQGRADLPVGTLVIEPDRNALAASFLASLRTLVLVDAAKSVLLAFALSILFFSALTRPLLRLAQAVKQTEPGKDDSLKQVAELKTQEDEIGNLVASFDDQLLQFKQVLEERSLLIKDLRLRDAALDAMDSGLLIVDCSDPQLPIVDANAAVREMFDLPTGSVMGQSLPSFIASLQPSRGESGPLGEFVDSAMTGPGSVAVYEFDMTDAYTRLYTISIVSVDSDGGDTSHRVILISDITTARETEDKLRHSQKMDALGKVAGGIAHDFNNMLAVMKGNLDMANIDYENEPGVQKFLGPIDRAVDRASELTRRLLRFSRKAPLHESDEKVDILIEQMRDLLASSLTPQIEIQLDLNATDCEVRLDRGDFEDALLNLAVNARDAIPQGGTLRLYTETTTISAESDLLRGRMTPGTYYWLRVSDTGTGMDTAVQQRLFEPFYTTKEASRGTGLGLSQVYGFVERSGGNIRVNSTPGKGSEFAIYLPLQTAGSSGEKSDTRRLSQTGGDETILLVDDENDLLETADMMLSRLGYTVIATASPHEAINLFTEKQDEIDLLMSDVVMPGGINGYELAHQLQELRPDLKVLMTSGYDSKRVGVESPFPLLAKPYSAAAIASSVRWVLDGAREGQLGGLPRAGTAADE